jgi:sugar phosphate isomerase/epimerase
MINGRKIGFFCSGGYFSMPFERMLDSVKSIGYDTVEMHWSIFNPDLGSAELRKILGKIERAGLELSEAVLQVDYINRDEAENRANIELTKKCIRAYAEAGINVINIFTGPRPWAQNHVVIGKDISIMRAWETAFAAFDELVPEAEKYGVNLAVESVWCHLCHDFFTTQYLLNHYNSPRLGVNFDPSHDKVAGNSDMEFLIAGYGKERIKHIHLKDAVGTIGKNERGEFNFMFPVLGEGLIDWQSFRRGLDKIGYDGVMSVEYESENYLSRYLDGDWERAASETYRVIEKLFG